MKKNIPPSRNLTVTTKNDLVSSVAEFSGLSKSMSSKALDIVLRSIGKGLKKKNKVSLHGFGSFSIAQLPERSGRNPRTQQAITIPAKKYPKFKAGEALKKAIA